METTNPPSTPTFTLHLGAPLAGLLGDAPRVEEVASTATMILDSYRAAAGLLIESVGVRKSVDAGRKQALSPYDSEVALWKARTQAAKAAEDEMREALLNALCYLEQLQDICLARPDLVAITPQLPEVAGIGYQQRQDVEITDPGALPREVLVPDLVAIRKLVAAGVQVPGVASVTARSVVVR